VANELDRFHLAADAVARVPSVSAKAAATRQWLRDKLVDHHRYINEHGEDLPEVREWRWDPSA
jgi:xylulose-5-phosphate/fructose-6-phosphate phosphoketolase